MESAALYLRLSNEDIDKINKGDDSESIQNQKLLLTEYALQHNYQIYNIYIDEDYSGWEDRPDYKRLIKDAKDRRFSTVICKSQSRFSREIEDIERYVHGMFFNLGIRFIGVVDNVDTAIKGNKKNRQISSLVNEWYVEDLSENVRAVLNSKMRNGQFIGSYAPYGYKKDPKNKHKLLIDDEAALVVRRIYKLCLEGNGSNAIAYMLTEKGILTPSEYKKSQGINYVNPYRREVTVWSEATVNKILSNQVYIGHLIQGQRTTKNYKSKQVITKPKSEWIKVPMTHEPIIDEDVFNKVQEERKLRKKRTSLVDEYNCFQNKKPHIFAGKIKCLFCGTGLGKSTTTKKTRRTYLRCRLAEKSRHELCKCRMISYDIVMDYVEKNIKRIIDCYINDQDISEMDKDLQYNSVKQGLEKKINLKQDERYRLSNEISRLQGSLAETYVDKTEGLISEDEFLIIRGKLKDKENGLVKRINIIDLELAELNKQKEAKNNFENAIKEFINFKELSHEMVAQLIDYIEVGRAENIQINIHWKF